MISWGIAMTVSIQQNEDEVVGHVAKVLLNGQTFYVFANKSAPRLSASITYYKPGAIVEEVVKLETTHWTIEPPPISLKDWANS